MDKQKYKNMKGEILELTYDEFINMPYNSKLTKMDTADFKPKEAKYELDRKTKELRSELVNEVGFSQKRANKVIAVYSTREDLMKNLDKDSFEKIENELLKEYYSKVKKIKDIADDIMDDGKRNYSNDPNKKKPGRKKKGE